jgi:D-beta-D-heptose 7-phosphate kinase/D-beta-D-heptose 1-phosphate adenosyltransferase
MAHHYNLFDAKSKTVLVSGGMDPIHVGHCRLLQEAAKYGNLVVVLNSDEWLKRKKGFAFMPFEERREIVSYIKGVHIVVKADDSDGTVCDSLRKYKPDFFANGGDRTTDNTPEMKICEELGIKMLWGVGGGKIQSSSELTAAVPKEDEEL